MSHLWPLDVLSRLPCLSLPVSLAGGLVLALLLAGVALVSFYRRRFRHWTDRGISGPEPRLLTGTTALMPHLGWHERDVAWISQFGKVYGTFAGAIPVLTIADQEALKEVLIREFASFADRVLLFSNCVRPSVIGINGPRWREQRTCLTPTFTSGKLRAMISLMQVNVDHLIRRLEARLSAAPSHEAQVSCCTVFGDLSMGVIASCAFATDLTSSAAGEKDEENPFALHAKRFFELSPIKLALFALLPDCLRHRFELTAYVDSPRFLVQMSQEILRKRRQDVQDGQRDGSGNRKPPNGVVDVLQLMLEAAKQDEKDPSDTGLTDEEIIANMILFLIAGYDTTKLLLSWTSFELARRPDIQERLRDEILQVIKSPLDEVDYDAIMSLKYLDAVMHESLRRYPPVVTIDRIASQDCEIKSLGIKLKKGETIQIPIYAIHHQAEYHPDPYTFDPERFMPGNKEKMLPCTFMPFMVGPRNCIGARFALLEAKAALVAILRRYVLSPSPRQQDPPDLTGVRYMLKTDDILVNYRHLEP